VGVFGNINIIELKYDVLSFVILIILENFQFFLNLFSDFQRFLILFSALY
jgi:hypothetical protein